MRHTLYGGPFDGFEYNDPSGHRREFLDLRADATWSPDTPGAPPPEGPAPTFTHVRYVYVPITDRYEWEGLHHGR